MSFFNQIPLLPEDPILNLPIAFGADLRIDKINLGIGAYKTAEGLPLVLSSVKKAESFLLQKNLNKDYLPIQGDTEFLKCGLQLLLGSDHPLLNSNCLFAAQTVGGSNALRIASEFLNKSMSKNIFIPQPSWCNHKSIFERAGLKVGSYPYLNTLTRSIDFKGMCEAILSMPPLSIILLHGCCHNPTGLDPSFEEWHKLSELIKKQRVFPLFDLAYQGFGEGLTHDAKAVRYFAEQGHELAVAYSFAKNFGLYGERAGFLTFFFSKPDQLAPLASQIKSLIRASFSNAPLHGGRIVATILKSLDLTEEWKEELHNMSERIKEMRKALVAALLVKSHGKNFFYLHQQKGLFSFTGLDPQQVERLRIEKGIYMPSNGRINIAGLNTQNINKVADALLSVM